MMSKEEIINFAVTNIGVPYKDKPPYSLIEGFNCIRWAKFLLDLAGKKTPPLDDDFKLTKKFMFSFSAIKLDTDVDYLDIVIFYLDILDERHVGVMLNDHIMSQCSLGTNGVSICNIRRKPWSTYSKGFYRLETNIS